jgi:hypothetical protein
MIRYILPLAVLSITLTSFEKGSDLVKSKRCAASYECLAQADAERILGLPAKETEHASKEKNGVTQFSCTYTAVDNATNKTSNLYYLYEQYKSPESAHAAYEGLVSANASMPGQTKIDSIGDETWLHTDRGNFDLVMCRKKNHMVRIKINKITSKTSLQALLQFVKETTSKM